MKIQVTSKQLNEILEYEDKSEIIKAIYDYKENPKIWHGSEQIEKIKENLLNTEEGEKIVEKSQEILKEKFGTQITVYRGGDDDIGDQSDAGWSTRMETALDFAAKENGILFKGTVAVNNVVYYDDAILSNSHMFNEEELILKNTGLVNIEKSIDVGEIEEKYADEYETYSDLGYINDTVEQQIRNKLEN